MIPIHGEPGGDLLIFPLLCRKVTYRDYGEGGTIMLEGKKKTRHVEKGGLICGLVILLALAIVCTAWATTNPSTRTTVDHKKIDKLHHSIKTGPDATKVCLSCHTEAAKQVQQTVHWTWGENEKGIGKAHIINNFCVTPRSNWCRCTSCHVGYGWSDTSFDFTAEANVDCLVCHEHSGKYKKFPTACGHPAYTEKKFGNKTFSPVDLSEVALTVGKPGLKNCGVCHFFGGGGDGTKHGDLDTSLLKADRKLDVHMSKQGANYTCTACHTTVDHQIMGRYYTKRVSTKHCSVMPDRSGSCISCESCHGPAPHTSQAKLNDHTDRVSCQACHIPTFARGGIGTMLWRDFSKAGRFTTEGKPIVETNADGQPTYDTKKGEMIWEKNIIPRYAWYDGSMEYVTLHDTLPAARPVELCRPKGHPMDPQSRIYPFKYSQGRQPYDAQANHLVIPKLFGPKGSGAFWAEFDWQRAVEAGMAANGEPFSGKLGFVNTAMYLPITHMVAPKEDSLRCSACHARNGRLAEVAGFYLPGRDRFGWLDMIGWFLVVLTIIGVAVHGFGRAISRSTKRNK